jgi:FkbM family methyltransferase
MTVPFPEFRSLCTLGYIGGAEKEVYEYLHKTITAKDIFFDIGANAGFYSLLAIQKGATVHAFEPIPSTFKLLEQNTEGKSISLHPVAVSSATGTVRMKQNGSSGLNRVDSNGNTVVQTITLDEFGVVPTIVKVDVEGHELAAFQGAERILREHKPIIVAEISDASAIDFLCSLGYTQTLLGKNNYVFV